MVVDETVAGATQLPLRDHLKCILGCHLHDSIRWRRWSRDHPLEDTETYS